MGIRLIGIDMDGTLLNSEKKLPKENVQAIREAVAQGVEFAYATGRIGAEMDEIYRLLPEVRYAILGNGALVKDLKEKKIIYSNRMSMDDVRTLYHTLEDFDMMFEVFSEEMLAVDKDCYANPDAYGVGIFRYLIWDTRTPVPSIKEYIDNREEPVGKINIFFKNTEQRDEAIRLTAHLPFETSYQEPTNLEYNVCSANKGNGLQALAEYLGLCKEEVMAIGDNNNDVPMLRYAGVAVAMGNAKPEALRCADRVVASCDNCGVAEAIRGA
ncbi:MAG: HAD family phosphatase [Erysipelotrichaceae bacterium]|nr:HAD family phosphatase [Erysipelotrichaceae bacterium]